MGADRAEPTADRQPPRTISPTDISQFIRLEQCERYLRLRLRERAEGRDVLLAYDVAPQPIPPILTRSGETFEQAVETGVRARFPTFRFTPEQRRLLHTPHDNDRLMELVRDLEPGDPLVLFQPRIEADIAGWRLRGDVDILRAERDTEGCLRLLIADMKSSTASRVEHRLQVAFYHRMLTALLGDAGIAHGPIELAILYRGPAGESPFATTDEREAREQERQRLDAEATLGASAGLLDRVKDVDAYLGSVDDLVTGSDSTARRVLRTDFEKIPFHLSYKCDGCLYNEFCMKRSAETDDLSLLPHIGEQDKRALENAGIHTTRQLAALKTLVRNGEDRPDGEVQDNLALVPAPGHEDACRQLAATWPVGPRLDELIHRALRYERWKTKQVDALGYIPNSGCSSLPYSDAGQNPNLVRVYLDVQHDYLNDRIYMLGALVTGNERGAPDPRRRRSVVRLTDGPPDADEREAALFVEWITETLRAIVEVAAPNADGEARAPIHLVFINGYAQRVLLDGLARHKDRLLGATALYDFVTQLAGFDSPIASYLEQEIREHRNYPMVCQSLQSVAAFLRFDWNAPEPYRDIFRTRLFDFWGRFDGPPDGTSAVPGLNGWYTSRARFNSQIPLEYAYAAWGELPGEDADEFERYRGATPRLLEGFHARRLEAMEHIAADFTGNRYTAQTEFALPDLAAFEEIARDLAHALDEFVTIERHVEMAAWRRERLAAPEQRVLSGQTLIVRYHERDQDPSSARQNRDNERRRALEAEYRAKYREAHPDAKQVRLPKAQREACRWTNEGLPVRLRITTDDVACDLDEALRLTTIRERDTLVIFPRWTVDSRLPADQQQLSTPTAKQLLYGLRFRLDTLEIERDRSGRALRAWAVGRLDVARGGSYTRGFAFPTMADHNRPLVPGETYTLDADPNSWNGYWSAKVTEGLRDGGENTLYRILAGATPPRPDWPERAATAQRRFMEGLDALHAAGAMHGFEPSKRAFIGEHGADPILLVQGPPGTGKSYSTAFALLARLQGAMAADRDLRIMLSCKTHAATDVLLDNVVAAQRRLRAIRARHPEIARDHFDPRLEDLPIYRLRPRGDVADGVTPLPRDDQRAEGTPKAVERLQGMRWLVAAGTPGAIYGLVKDHWDTKDLFGHHLVDCLVLDEASQMSMPEAIMAALPLGPDGTVIVVGDHRQMPPIVKHDWASEPRRSFRQFRSYESLFLALLALEPPMIQFAESFRLHADMARFLRDEIYIHDGIDYHSNRDDVLPRHPTRDEFIAAVLAPEHPLTVVVHDETRSQVRNTFERNLILPVLRALADPSRYNLDPAGGMGVVVPHRAQRAAMQQELTQTLGRRDAAGTVASAVDTVERFQGGERTAILIGATESDREYILMNGAFLLDPRRLTVALSRAKRKLVLVAARSVFEVFSADEETFAHAQLWKNLLRRTCTVPLWDGRRYGHDVTVWGNRPSGDH